jgi:hypothetical protein
MEAEIHIICVAFTGLVASAVMLAQAAPYPNQQNWHPLGAAVTFGLGDQACGIRSSGATGTAIGGGGRACPIDNRVPLGRCLNS